MSLDFICGPLGKFLYFIYNSVHSYGLAIIIFTILVRLALLPLTIKQYKSTAKTQEIQPLIQDLQKRYKNDKEKLNQEMMKVYQENNVNPAGGCLPLLIQFPILISLYWVIVQPLKFMLDKTPAQIAKLTEVATQAMTATGHTLGYQKELSVLNFFYENRSALDKVSGILSSKELIDFNFLGLHLGVIPSYKTNLLFGADAHIYLPLLLIPILAAITTFISTKLSMPKNMQNNAQNGMASSMTNSMMYVGPIMTLFISFGIPAGVGLYWIVGYVFAIFQQLYINKHVIKRNDTADAKVIADKSSSNNNNNNSNKNNNKNNKQIKNKK